MDVRAFARMQTLASLASTHRALRFLHLQEQRIRGWQRAVVAIPSPPFGEAARAAWFAERFCELGLTAVGIDVEGNALGWLRAYAPGEPVVLLSAHLDTVFPAGTPTEPDEDGNVLRAPGAADNGAGLAALLALAAAALHQREAFAANVLFAANTGEEAEGDLRGMRFLFERAPFAGDVVASIALEGVGQGTLVTRGLGSRRFRVTVRGPGGHAWTDAERPNPLLVLAGALQQCANQPLPRHPRTTFNVGQMSGGTGVTSVPESATALIDLRSTDPTELLRLEVRLFRAVEDAVLAANARAGTALMRFVIEQTGDRPTGELARTSPLLHSVLAVDRHLRVRTDERIGSTDANVPLSLGRDAIAIGAGGSATGIHTLAEAYDSTGRELALRRILLLLLDVCSERWLRDAGRTTLAAAD